LVSVIPPFIPKKVNQRVKMRRRVKNILPVAAIVLVTIVNDAVISSAFVLPSSEHVCMTLSSSRSYARHSRPLFMSDEKANQVVELIDDDETTSDPTEETKSEEKTTAVAPFLSQGEISEEAMEMDWSDPKQARVMFYIILSLLPVLFLIPLMLGSRDLIPVESLPPVELN
jgi:hypothetical protein